EQRVKRAGVAKLILRHRRRRHARFQRRRAAAPLGVAPPQEVFVVGQARDQAIKSLVTARRGVLRHAGVYPSLFIEPRAYEAITVTSASRGTTAISTQANSS